MGGTNINGVNKLYKEFGVTLSIGLPAQVIYLCSVDKIKKIMQSAVQIFSIRRTHQEEHSRAKVG
jgi:hypothetical protein